MSAIKSAPSNWLAFDSEFIADAKREDELGVYSIQAIGADGTHIFATNPDEWWSKLKDWVMKQKANGYERVFLWGFVALADVGPIDTWGANRIFPPLNFTKSYDEIGVQDRWVFKLYGIKIRIHDLQPLASTMSMGTLKLVGEFLTADNKLEHPDKPDNHANCLHKLETCIHGNKNHLVTITEGKKLVEKPWRCPDYAMRDAEITLAFAKYLLSQDIDPERIGTPGQLAAKIFPIPERNNPSEYVYLNGYLISVLEKNLRLHATFAGRNECYRNGGPYPASYVDRTSLYPECMLRSKAPMIRGTELCSIDDIDLSPGKWSSDGFGWGMFTALRCDDEVWSFPKRQENVVYCTGDFSSEHGMIRATDDLLAGQTKIVEDPIWVCRPIFAPPGSPEEEIQNTLEELFDQRVKGELPFEKKGLLKGAMNALSGKYGASTPNAGKTTNYLVYSALLARSHLLMADFCRWAINTHDAKLFGFDTDGIVLSQPLEEKGTRDGIPYKFGLQEKKNHKMTGNMIYYRAKQYVMECDDGTLLSAHHGWHYDFEKFEALGGRMMHPPSSQREDNSVNLDGEGLVVIQQDKHTMNTATKAAKMLRLGGWVEKEVKLTEAKLTELLWADRKRNRGDYIKEPERYDSYHLAKDGKWVDSKPWVFRDWASYSYDVMSSEYDTLLKKKSRFQSISTIESIANLYADTSQLTDLPIGFKKSHLDKLVKQVLKARARRRMRVP
jgi:hypothetical protein